MTDISSDAVTFAQQIEYKEGFFLGHCSCLLFIFHRSTPVKRCIMMGQEAIWKSLILSRMK